MSRQRYQRVARPPRPQGYDVPMIRDFLDQLVMELRANNYEQSAPAGQCNPELVEELENWRRKRGTYLLARNCIAGEPDLTAEEFAKAAALYREHRRQETEALIQHLEALHELFHEAFYCAERPGKNVWHEVSAREWLLWSEGENEPGETQADDPRSD